jgi:Concanavalin A-like lectin/glucanases superfamily
MKKTIYFLIPTLLLLNFSTPIKAQMGNVLNFDGVDDYIRTTNDVELQLTTGTVEAWVKAIAGSSDYHGIVVKQIAYGLLMRDGKLVTYDWTTSSERNSNTLIADGSWHHVAMSFESGVASGTKLYVDGVLKLTTTFTVSAPAGHEITIGTGTTNANGQFFPGSIDEVRVWNVVRTEMDIANNRSLELVGNELGLVAYHKFNQGTPSGNNAGVNTLPDATSFANTGTLYNFDLIGVSSNWVSFGTVLPVELLSFKGTPQYESVKLTWQTRLNENSKGFQIERLKAWGSDWEVLGFVPSDSKNATYQYVDNSLLADRNVNYYRLRQIDNDGKENFSKIVSVAFNKAKSLKIYPSIVFDGVLNLEMTGKGADTEGSSFAVFNLLGQQMLHGKMQPQLDVAALPFGTYIIKVGTEQAKFVKQ